MDAINQVIARAQQRKAAIRRRAQARRPEFANLDQAMAAGFDQAVAGLVLDEYRGYRLAISDETAGYSYGYDYGLVGVPRQETRGTLHKVGPFGRTVDVQLMDTINKVGRKGAMLPMFAPGVLDVALESARAAIDQQYQEEECYRERDQYEVLDLA